MEREGFLPVFILPVIWLGKILSLHKKFECSAPLPRCCLWASVSLSAILIPQWGKVPAGEEQQQETEASVPVPYLLVVTKHKPFETLVSHCIK